MNKLLLGDSLDVLKEIESESVDLLCTDPPYGYSFLGKSWDKTLPDIGIFKECLRVLKPGSFAFVMSAPRSDVCARMMLLLEDAGFEIGFTPIYWTYASGFPKAMNVSKAVDKRLGHERERIAGGAGTEGNTFPLKPEAISPEAISPEAIKLDGSYGGFQPKPAVEVVIVAMKPLSEKTYVDQALKNGKGITWLDDCRVPTEQNLGRPIGRGDKDDKIYGKYNAPRGTRYGDEQTGRFPANLIVSDDVLNDGRVQKSGTAVRRNSGGLNIHSNTVKPAMVDLGHNDSGSYSRYFDLDAWSKTLPFLIVPKAAKSEKNAGLGGTLTVKYNVCITPNKQVCRDATTVAVRLLERVISDTGLMSFSIGESGASITAQFLPASSSIIKITTSKIIESRILNSLMLSLTSESTEDANSETANGGSLADDVASLRAWLLTITNGETELARGASHAASQMLSLISDEGEWKPTSNVHSTVKPLKLMSYLITLGSRPGDVVLDPFLGSGTTALAAKQLGRKYIGIEREKEYFDIAQARLDSVQDSLI